MAASVVIVLVTRPGVDGSSDSSGDLICEFSTMILNGYNWECIPIKWL